jgi:hypothetical protein
MSTIPAVGAAPRRPAGASRSLQITVPRPLTPPAAR